MMEDKASEAQKYSEKMRADSEMIRLFREQPGDCIGGHKESFKLNDRRRDR